MTIPRSALIISAIALILLALVPAVSANTIIYDEDLYEYIDTSESLTVTWSTTGLESTGGTDTIVFKNITRAQKLNYLVFEIPGDHGSWASNLTKIEPGRYDFTYHFNGADRPGVLYLNRKTNLLGQVTSTQFTIFLNDWYIGDLTGKQSIKMPFYFFYGNYIIPNDSQITKYPATNVYLSPIPSERFGSVKQMTITEVTGFEWKHHLTVREDSTSYYVDVYGFIDFYHHYSQVNFSKDGELFATIPNPGGEIHRTILKTYINLIEIITPRGKVFSFPLGIDVPGDPSLPLRTGTVTMTDHNGTTLSGFEVTAVNFFTGESYTVSTETDTAVITLPMDRTMRIRNPQTGVYEDTVVGYYRFYGHKPDYRMLNEEGIQVSVLPEKYSSYQLCDILVTSESGYLTGKHLFQIRSRADNSILQTGTISAKSATTGNWYNTTVINGLATLILPYDTSNPISRYAGNYYVYATSPGYEDSDYGTQITVMPHTQSEINTILLTPIGGIPEPGNVTLRIQAFSETGPGIPNASIFIAGVDGAGRDFWETYITSSTGYLEVSVPANSTYDIVASAPGYYDSSRRIEVSDVDPALIELKLYLTGWPTQEPTTQPTGWPTTQPTTQPTGGIPDEDDDSEGFLMEAIRSISRAFGVGFATGKMIFGMLLALAIGFATAKQLRGGAAEFGLGLLGGTMLGVLIGLLPVWVIVVLLLIVGMYIGYRYVGGSNSG